MLSCLPRPRHTPAYTQTRTHTHTRTCPRPVQPSVGRPDSPRVLTTLSARAPPPSARCRTARLSTTSSTCPSTSRACCLCAPPTSRSTSRRRCSTAWRSYASQGACACVRACARAQMCVRVLARSHARVQRCWLYWRYAAETLKVAHTGRCCMSYVVFVCVHAMRACRVVAYTAALPQVHGGGEGEDRAALPAAQVARGKWAASCLGRCCRVLGRCGVLSGRCAAGKWAEG